MSIPNRISWDHYEKYVRCPQLFSWEFLVNKIPQAGYKDTQHIIRGNASQLLVDKWISEDLWRSTTTESQDVQFIDNNTHRCVIESWMRDSNKGTAKIQPLSITAEITPNLYKIFPTLRKSFYSHSSKPIIVKTQVNISSKKEDLGFELHSRSDILVYLEDGSIVIYEGKATRKPKYTKDDQVRWQAQILRESLDYGLYPALNHYFFFFHTNELKQVECFIKNHDDSTDYSIDHWEWLKYRDFILQRIKEGDYKATPSRLDCQICDYRPVCPDRYRPKSKEPSCFEPPSKGGISLNIL